MIEIAQGLKCVRMCDEYEKMISGILWVKGSEGREDKS